MLNISKQIFIAWDPAKHLNQKCDLNEVEIVPIGESKKEKKKIDSLLESNPCSTEYDNVPLPGFTLYDVGKKNWSASDSSWLIIDPRGFMVRITNKNLANILKVTGITEGLIQQKCVWAREDEDTNLSLVPISSNQYVDAVENTKLIEDKVSVKDVKIGDTVLLQNGLAGKYLGVLSMYGTLQLSAGYFKIISRLRKQVIEVQPGKFHYGTDIKILKVTTKANTEQTREESMSYINSCIKTNTNTVITTGTNMTRGYYGSYEIIKFVSVHAVPNVSIRLEEITKKEAETISASCKQYLDNGCLILEDTEGKKFAISYPWLTSIHTDPSKFNTIRVINVGSDRIKLEGNSNNSFYYASSVPPTHSLNKFTKFYKIVKYVKNDTYL